MNEETAVAVELVVVVVAEEPAIGVPVPMEKGTTGATVPEPAIKLNPLANDFPIWPKMTGAAVDVAVDGVLLLGAD